MAQRTSPEFHGGWLPPFKFQFDFNLSKITNFEGDVGTTPIEFSSVLEIFSFRKWKKNLKRLRTRVWIQAGPVTGSFQSLFAVLRSDSIIVTLSWRISLIRLGTLTKLGVRGSVYKGQLLIEVRDKTPTSWGVDCGAHLVSYMIHLARWTGIPNETGANYVHSGRDTSSNENWNRADDSTPLHDRNWMTTKVLLMQVGWGATRVRGSILRFLLQQEPWPPQLPTSLFYQW